MPNQRLFYIDNLRIFLIALVVLHHLAITYGAPGGWYYNESQADFPAIIPLAMFVASNQAFFMGMFFFISAFFIVPSLSRKGNKQFIKDRLLRLGLPLVIFYFILSPFTVYIHSRFIQNNDYTFLEHIQNGWGQGFGPMWFVEALLIFTSLYLFFRLFGGTVKMKFPVTSKILLIAFAIGIVQSIIRIWLPVGWSFMGTGLQFPHFLQYIFLFAFGIVAYQNNWMNSITPKMGMQWFIFAQVLIFICFPVLFILGGAADEGTDKFMGGLNWQCFAYTIWEQLLGFSLIIGLFGIFKKRFNKQGKLAKKLSGSAYGVFLFHTPILLIISAAFLNCQLPQFLKFVVLAPIALIFCFGFASLIKQIPGVKKIL